jgi:hypothetical protein
VENVASLVSRGDDLLAPFLVSRPTTASWFRVSSSSNPRASWVFCVRIFVWDILDRDPVGRALERNDITWRLIGFIWYINEHSQHLTVFFILRYLHNFYIQSSPATPSLNLLLYFPASYIYS